MIALLLLLVAPPAEAYELLGMDWAWQDDPIEEPVFLNLQSFPAHLGDGVEDSLLDAIDAWSFESGADVEVRYAGSTTHDQWGGGPDGINLVLFEEQGPDATLAQASFSSVGGRILDCDIRFFGANGLGPIQWHHGVEEPPADHFDLATVAIHELGHCLGLGHSEVHGARMYPTVAPGRAARHLHEDDMAGLRALYGERDVRLKVADTWIDDPEGDQDGRAERGEPIQLWVLVDNHGAEAALDVVLTLENTSPDLEVVEGGGALGDLAPGASQATWLDLKVSEDCTLDTHARVHLYLSDEDGVPLRTTHDLPLRCSVESGLVHEVIAGVTCATGGPAGLWAVLLALPLVLRRRAPQRSAR